MKRITKESWFMPNSKEFRWIDRGRPITWQGWTITSLFLILYIILFYAVFSFKEWAQLWILITCWMWLPFKIAVSLTSDQPKLSSGITNKEISRRLKEKREKNTD